MSAKATDRDWFLIEAIDAHHAALSEDVVVEAMVEAMAETDALTPWSSESDTGLFVIHEEDLEVLARAALQTVADAGWRATTPPPTAARPGDAEAGA